MSTPHPCGYQQAVAVSSIYFPFRYQSKKRRPTDGQRDAAGSGGVGAERGPDHITSTKNSLGFPIAMRKDCLLAVSSGGTEARSRPGGAPGGPMAAGGGVIISIGGP